MPRYHLDTDFLVFATSETGLERERLLQIAASDATIEMSAIAWYEYARGPRLPEQLALARFVLEDDGVIPLTDELASRAADTFRLLGSPRRRANDVAWCVPREKSFFIYFVSSDGAGEHLQLVL